MEFGIDNVLLSRMKTLSPSFPRRVLSAREYQEYQASAAKDEYLAGRFAAKEAYIKASGNLKMAYNNIEVLADETGKPNLYIMGKIVGKITITHDFVATALVVLDA